MEALAQKTASSILVDRERLLARIGAAGVDQRRELRGALADVDLPLGLVAFRRVIGEAVCLGLPAASGFGRLVDGREVEVVLLARHERNRRG